MTKCWSFLSLEDADRQFTGNAGYEDVISSYYSFDATVPNHRRVSVGDLAVIRDGAHFLGSGWIDHVDVWREDKARHRCPECGRTGFKKRTTIEPGYRCGDCRATFEQPTVDVLADIEHFRAQYSRTWQELDRTLLVKDHRSLYRSNATQHAIRELNLDLWRSVAIADGGIEASDWNVRQPGGAQIPGGHRVALGRVRVGQAAFRQDLLDLCGSVCAVSGPMPASVLEAAHLYRYSETAKHDVRGGLLLRRDLHALFDRFRLLIETSDWTVHLHPALARYDALWAYNGRTLSLPEGVGPRPEYLDAHASVARSSWQ